jgi:RNA recognition motif-containing protein
MSEKGKHGYPANCRIFLGNLASEKTSRKELMEIFGKYGRIVEEIVMRRSFGFVQYDNPESAQMAIKKENGRIIGGMRVGTFISSLFSFLFSLPF